MSQPKPVDRSTMVLITQTIVIVLMIISTAVQPSLQNNQNWLDILYLLVGSTLTHGGSKISRGQ